jgi:hypothetical protein
MIVIFIATTILHLIFAATGWLYRYEAYLMVLGIFVIIVGISECLPKKLFVIFEKNLIPAYVAIFFLISFVVIIPFLARGVKSLFVTYRATKNIYEQQYQMGLFLDKFYKGEGVAANDIGAINYLADIKNLDLFGLGSMEITKSKIDKNYTTRYIDLLTKKKEIKIAVVYDEWFDGIGGLPQDWIKVGEWSIPDNTICGGDTVSFYAVKYSEKENLIANLKIFSTQLPEDVVQSGDYVK